MKHLRAQLKKLLLAWQKDEIDVQEVHEIAEYFFDRLGPIGEFTVSHPFAVDLHVLADLDMLTAGMTTQEDIPFLLNFLDTAKDDEPEAFGRWRSYSDAIDYNARYEGMSPELRHYYLQANSDAPVKPFVPRKRQPGEFQILLQRIEFGFSDLEQERLRIAEDEHQTLLAFHLLEGLSKASTGALLRWDGERFESGNNKAITVWADDHGRLDCKEIADATIQLQTWSKLSHPEIAKLNIPDNVALLTLWNARKSYQHLAFVVNPNVDAHIILQSDKGCFEAKAPTLEASALKILDNIDDGHRTLMN